jgi:hypothetical protein
MPQSQAKSGGTRDRLLIGHVGKAFLLESRRSFDFLPDGCAWHEAKQKYEHLRNTHQAAAN